MPELTKNLVLTGMMGVGKSTIGKILSQKLKLKLLDIDKIIEKNEGQTIKNIFETKGESYFRKIEASNTLDALLIQNSVIALGGGAFLNPALRRKIIDNTISFWLDLKSEFIIRRIRNISDRPMLNKKNFKNEIKKISLERRKFYSMAKYRINCNGRNKIEIANKIREIYIND